MCDFPTMPEGWHIEYNPKPIRGLDWDYWHDDHDGENGLSGTGSSFNNYLNQIEDRENG